jgi:hypothetical protein
MKTKDKIPGGLAAGKSDSDFDPVQLEAGIRVELEHSSDRAVAKEIAKDHLCEDRNYYKKLRKIEKAMDPLIKSVLSGEKSPLQASRELAGSDQTGFFRELRKARQQGLFGAHPAMRAGQSTSGEQMGLFGRQAAQSGGKGPGSRGGQVIGRYPDGSPRYADKAAANPYGKHPSAGTEGPPQSHGEGWEPVHGSKEGGWRRKGEKTGTTPSGKPVHHYDHWFPGGKEKQPGLFDKGDVPGDVPADQIEKKYLGTFSPSAGVTGGAAPAGYRPGKVKPLGETSAQSERRASRMGMATAEKPKGAGEGSRGGQVAGHSASGKPIYARRVGGPPPIPGGRPKPPPIPTVTKGGPPRGSFARIREEIMSGPGKKPDDPDAVAAMVYRKKYGAETLARRSAAARKEKGKAAEKAAAVLAGEEPLRKAFGSLEPTDQVAFLRELRKARKVHPSQTGFAFGAPAAGAKPAGRAGEGSRGGHVIGHTKSGKPIYESAGHAEHGGFSAADHADAAAKHGDLADYHKRSGNADRGPNRERHQESERHHRLQQGAHARASGQSAGSRIMGAAESARFAADAADRKKEADAAHAQFHGTGKPRPHERSEDREIREIHEGAKTADQHIARGAELLNHAKQFSPTHPKESAHHYALRNAADSHRIAAERGSGEGAGTYDAASHSRDAQKHEKRPEVQAALAEVERRKGVRGGVESKEALEERRRKVNAPKLPPGIAYEGEVKGLDHQKRAREHEQKSRELGGGTAYKYHRAAVVAHKQAADHHFGETPEADSKSARAEHASKAAAHFDKAVEHQDAPYSTGAGAFAEDVHRTAAKAHHAAAASGSGEDKQAAELASREAEHRTRLAEHSYKIEDHRKVILGHMHATDFHGKMADRNRRESSRLRSKNPSSPKAKKMDGRAEAHVRAQNAHNKAGAVHSDAVEQLRRWGDPDLPQHKGALEFSASAHERSKGAYAESAKLGFGGRFLGLLGRLGPGDITQKSMQPGATPPPGKDPLMKDKSKPDEKNPKPNNQNGNGADDGEPGPGHVDYHREQAMKHLAAAQAHANAHHSAKKIAETGDHDEKVQAAEEASQGAIKKGGMIIDLGAEQDVLAYLDGGGVAGAAFDTLPDPRGPQRMAALRGGVMVKAEGEQPERYIPTDCAPGGGVAGGPIYQGENDQQGSRGGDNREAAMRLKEQLFTVEDDPAGNRGQGGLDEWWGDAYGNSQGQAMDVNVPVGPMSMVSKAEEPPVQVIDDSDPYTRALFRTDPRDGMAGLRMAYQGEGRDKGRRGQ